MKRHWVINGRFLAQPMTGVQRYASEIVRALDAILLRAGAAGSDLDIELLVPPDADSSIELEGIAVRRVGRLRGHAWEQLSLPKHVRGGLLSLCNTGPVNVRRQIACIHDLNTRVYPQSYSPTFRAAYRTLLPALGRAAQAVCTVSRHSANDLVRFGICPAEKIFLAPNGHEHALRWRSALSPDVARASGRNTIVVIGSLAPHKNSGLVMGLAETLAAAGLDLAVVGISDPRVFRSAPHHKAPNISWLGRLNDGEMAALLQDCLCLAFPSFAEGFGLPPLEAMARGCPVVVSDRASLPEICGAAALYAPPDQPEAWLQCFMRLAGTPSLRREMIARGRARASAFRWQASAERYLEAMADADGVAYHRQMEPALAG